MLSVQEMPESVVIVNGQSAKNSDNRVATGQGKITLQGKEKVRKFYFESGKINILKKSQ